MGSRGGGSPFSPGGPKHPSFLFPHSGLLPLSDWSPWTACSDCLPLAALGPRVLPALLEQAEASWLSSPVQVSVRHRYRLCLDPQTGQPWRGPDGVCTAELDQRRLCPDETGACQGNPRLGICAEGGIAPAPGCWWLSLMGLLQISACGASGGHGAPAGRLAAAASSCADG